MSEEIMSAEAGKPARTLEQVTQEIRYLDTQAKRLVLGHAIEIGRRLEEAKAMVPYGEWGNYISRELEYSQSTANNFMRIYNEYGAAQQSLFGPVAESQTFGKLSYSKALQLLAVPREEREAFAEAVDAEHLSTRELEQAIRERDEARKVKEAIKASLEATEKKAAEDLQKAKERAKTEREKLERKLKEAEDKLAAAGAEDRAEADRLRTETEALKKQLAMSGTETVIFKLRFSAWQEAYRLMTEAFAAIQDEETKAKLRTAIKAQVKNWGYGEGE